MAKYKKEKLKEIFEWVKEYGLMDYGGAMLKDFSEAMDIEEETYYQWMKKTEFFELIKKAKEIYKSGLELKLVTSLAKSAQGFDTEDVTTEYIDGKDGKPKVRHQVRKKHHIPPNTGAAIFLLTNLNGEVWKNKQNADVRVEKNAFEELMKELDKEEYEQRVTD